MSEQATITGSKPSGPPRNAAGGVCHAPAEMECLQEYHPGKCKTRPCKHCSTGCMYWGRK